MTAAPPPVSSRIEGFDFARAIAIFGMVTVNFRVVLADSHGPEWLNRLADQVDGRAAALFVFLAGLGISLLSSRSRASGDPVAIRDDRMTLWKRALFLFVVGLCFRRIWEYDILHFYGVYLCIAALLLTASSRTLAFCAFLAAAVFPLLYYVLPGQFGIPFWDTTNGLTPRDIAIDIFFQGYHPLAPWLAFLFAGMIVGRLDLGDRALRRRLLIGGVAAALAAEAIAFALLGTGLLKPLTTIAPGVDIEAVADGFGTDPYPPMPLFAVVGTGWAMAVTALCLSAGERFAGRAGFTPFVHAGQLALTVYIVHGSVAIWALDWAGLGGRHSVAWTLGYAVVFYAVIVLLATLWRRRFARGPVETIMRWITRNRKSEIVPEEAPA